MMKFMKNFHIWIKLKASNCKDKKIIISIFSQNRELSSLNEEVADRIKAIKSNSINNSMGKYKDNKPKNDKKIKPNAANTLYDGDEEEEEIIERKNKKKKIKETENMKILKELKEEDKKDEKEDDLNNSRYYGEDNEPSEPDFYADEDDGG